MAENVVSRRLCTPADSVTLSRPPLWGREGWGRETRRTPQAKPWSPHLGPPPQGGRRLELRTSAVVTFPAESRTEGVIHSEKTDVFTGLVEGLGRLERAIDENAGRRLEISSPGLADDGELRLGESIAINGCCLTAIAVALDRFEVQAGPETLARTNLGSQRGRPRQPEAP